MLEEESPVTNPELYETIENEVEGKAVEVIKKKRKRRKEELPLPLEKLSGREVVEILDFLHRRYLSWMTEAEASKFAVVYKSAKEDALKESLEIYNELSKQQQQIVESLTKLAERLEKISAPREIAKEVVQEAKKSLLDDPRIRSLIFVALETFLGKNAQYKKFRPFIAQLLLPEAFQQPKTPPEEAQEEQEENKEE